jgi:hypothetical protein
VCCCRATARNLQPLPCRAPLTRTSSVLVSMAGPSRCMTSFRRPGVPTRMWPPLDLKAATSWPGSLMQSPARPTQHTGPQGTSGDLRAHNRHSHQNSCCHSGNPISCILWPAAWCKTCKSCFPLLPHSHMTGVTKLAAICDAGAIAK